MPSKISSDQGAKVQEYFVYFKLLQRRAGGNLPVDADGGLISVSHEISAVSNDVTHVSQKKRRYGMGSFLVGFGAGARRAEAKKPTKNGALSGGLLFGQQFFWALIA